MNERLKQEDEAKKQGEFADMPRSSKALQDAIAELEIRDAKNPKPTKEEELAKIRKEIIESGPGKNPNIINLNEILDDKNNKK